MGGRRRNIQEYQKMLHEYKKRRNVYMLKYGVDSKEYLNCRRQIHNIHRAINRWYKRKQMMDSLRDKIKEFIGVDVSIKLLKGKQDLTKKVAKAIFVKYGMQNGISGTDIGNYVGYADPSVCASRLRTKFTKSFKDNDYNKQMYHGFLKFIKRKD